MNASINPLSAYYEDSRPYRESEDEAYERNVQEQLDGECDDDSTDEAE